MSLVIEKGIVEVSEKQLKNIPISYYELVDEEGAEDEVENIEDEVENIEGEVEKKSSKVKKK